MESIKLHSVALNKSVTYLSKTFNSVIRPNENNVVDLEFQPGPRVIKVTFETKPEMPTVVLIPFDSVAGIIPEPDQKHLEAGIAPRVAPPEPVYVPEPLPVPAPEPPTVTVEQAEAIRKRYHAVHKAPKPQGWEVETAAYAEKKQRRHMGLSVAPCTADNLLSEPVVSIGDPTDPVAKYVRIKTVPSSPKDTVTIGDPKPKKAKRKNKRKGK